MSDTIQIAPLQLLVVGFDQPRFSGKIAAELEKARNDNLIRVVDAALVRKDEAGKIETRQQSDLSFDEIGTYGEVLGALIGIGSGSEDFAEKTAEHMRGNFEERYEFGLDKEDVMDIAENLPNDSATMFILLEHIWALPLRNAMREAGGMLLAQDFLSPELLVAIGQQRYAEATS